MDVFSRTFLPAAAEAGLALPAISRHMPIFRRCVGSDDPAILVTRCTRPGAHGEYLLLLTYRRMVVIRQTPMLHRLRLHLNTELQHLGNVTWTPDPHLPGVELAATAVDGIRERFLIRAGHPKQVWQFDALLNHAFRIPVKPHRERVVATVTGPAAAPRAQRLRPVAFG